MTARHPFRAAGRVLWAAAELSLAAMNFLRGCAFRSEVNRRAKWLQQTSKRLLRVLAGDVAVCGPLPKRGLLICNHLSYVDVLVLASLMPAFFVAKHEVRSWPVFGWFARRAGTLFIDRERRTHVGRISDDIQSVLDHNGLVILFPEGTSSDGQTVLPFKSSLLEPATRQVHSLTAGLIQYELEDGDVREDVCYWRDVPLAAHLLNLLGKRCVRASVRFTRLNEVSTDRKQLARQLHSEVLKLKSAATA